MDDAAVGALFLGSLDIGGTQEFSLESPEPWPWTDEARSTIGGSSTMEDRDGNPADATFGITCP